MMPRSILGKYAGGLLVVFLMDREWGHITIKMSGHPPFGAQVILNGYEYVACRAKKPGWNAFLITTGRTGRWYRLRP